MKEEWKNEEKKRTHIRSRFMRESLVSKAVMGSTKRKKVFPILPNANVIMIGGKSIMDRGKSAVFPLVEEIRENRKKHKMIFAVSGGVRLRHTLDIGMDLGLPTGGLAMVAGAVEEQNSVMLYALLAKDGGICLPRDCFKELPLYLNTGMMPILVCMPPHHYWEKPPRMGALPEYGSDFGTYMIAEVLSAKSMIFVKDQDGIFSDHPEKNPRAEFIAKIHVKELLQMNLKDLPIERSVLHSLFKSPTLKRIWIINGLKKGNLTRALEGEDVGTVVYKD